MGGKSDEYGVGDEDGREEVMKMGGGDEVTHGGNETKATVRGVARARTENMEDDPIK